MTRSIVSVCFISGGLLIFGNWFVVSLSSQADDEVVTDQRKPYTLTNPQYESRSQAQSWLTKDDQIVGVLWRGQARAYPIRILQYYELVNDVIDGTPIAIWYYPPTSEVKVFSRTFHDQTTERLVTLTLTDQVTHDGPLALDKAIGFRWNLQGKPFENHHEPLELMPFGSYEWSAWQTLFPNTTVLARPPNVMFDYSVKPLPAPQVSLTVPVTTKGDEHAPDITGE